jgi:hypothetical protein
LANKDQDTEDWNGFNPIRVSWREVPGRDDTWRKNTLAALSFDMQKFSQEYEVEFQGSSGTLISGDKLKALVHQVPITNDRQGLVQYFRPEPGHAYVLVADVSRGKGLDYSAFQVIDVTKAPYQQVCVFRSNLILTTDYSDIIYRIAVAYNQAHVLVENNDIGAQVVDILHLDYEYEHLLFTRNAGAHGKAITFGGKGHDQGVRTSSSVKAIGCSMLKALVEQDKLIINDFDTIEELSVFSKRGKSYEAEPGKHDDLVMPLVLFGWMSNQAFFKDLTDYDIMKALRDKTVEEIEESLLPFGFIVDGREEDEFDPYGEMDRSFYW